MNAISTELPLTVWTSPEWAASALQDPITLLNDHAHLEKKAATNALTLLQRWPSGQSPTEWVQALTSVSRDEALHLSQVTRLLKEYGGELTRHHDNDYAASLHNLVRYGDGIRELLDRLMVSALIEARSCERFALLAEAATDPRLSKLYKSLWASERGHYRLFHDLAKMILPESVVEERWQEMVEEEGNIIKRQSPGPRIHSWI